jgi:hypothetical protein
MLEQLELAVCALGKDRCAEGLHDLLDGNILVGELITGRTVGIKVSDRLLLADFVWPGKGRLTYQTSPKAPIPTGCRSEYLWGCELVAVGHDGANCEAGHPENLYLEVISNVVPKICARTNSAMMNDLFEDSLEMYLVGREKREEKSLLQRCDQMLRRSLRGRSFVSWRRRRGNTRGDRREGRALRKGRSKCCRKSQRDRDAR